MLALTSRSEPGACTWMSDVGSSNQLHILEPKEPDKIAPAIGGDDARMHCYTMDRKFISHGTQEPMDGRMREYLFNWFWHVTNIII